MSSPATYWPGAHRHSTFPAVVEAETGRSIGFAELDDSAWQIARDFRSRGLGPGDVVCLCLENSLAFVQLMWGAHYAGLRYTPVSARSTIDEISYVLRNSGARLLLLSASIADRFGEEALADLRDLLEVVPVDVTADLSPKLMGYPAEPIDGAVEGAAQLYSSGTSGRPKAIKPARSSDPLGTAPSLLVKLADKMFGLSAGSVYLMPAPIHHAAPMGFIQACGRLGATAVIMKRFQPEAFLSAIATYGVTHTQVVPTMFGRLLALPQEVRVAADTSTLTHVIHAAAPCPVDVKREMFGWLGPIIHEYYSGSEGVGFVYCGPQDWLAHPGTVGKSMSGKIHILAPDGTELPTGESGAVYFENPRRIEYLGEAAKTKEVYTEQGWGTFGDIGRVDDEGFLYLTDRKNEMIISGGVNVYPQEVENALIAHPWVADVAVIGKPDADLGERVTAVVQLTPGVSGDDALAQELMAFSRQTLAAVKSPRQVDFVAELPRTETGKLLRRVVREQYRATSNTVHRPPPQ